MADTKASATSMKAMPCIHLNGFPGTGKLTIARKLVEKINTGAEKDEPNNGSGSQTRAKLVHNHLLIDPAGAVLDRTQPGYQQLRKAIREAVFTSLVNEKSTYETIYVFTDWQSGDDVGSGVCEDFQTMAKARGSLFIPILITCDEKENVRRIQGAGRAVLSTKVTDPGILLQWRQEVNPPPVYQFRDHKARLEVDVTSLSAEQAAEVILKHASQYVPVW